MYRPCWRFRLDSEGEAHETSGGLLSILAGLYQVVVTVPATPANGDYPLVAAVGGVATATTTLTVHN
jgi:uncharacterized protein (TIGR03437 family)